MKFINCLILSLLSVVAFGQKPKALLQADTGKIRMGEKINLTLSLFYSNAKNKATIIWPTIGDTLPNQAVYIVDRSNIDTLPLTINGKDELMMRQQLSATSFDSATYTVGPFAFVVNGDTILSNPITFDLLTFEVDTTLAIKDIKSIEEVPYTFMDWLMDNKIFILIAAALLFLAYFIISFITKKRRKKLALVAEEIIHKPAHEIALEMLESMRKNEAWLKVTAKNYYTELTDILRDYVERRYNMLAKEQTTNELLNNLLYTDCSPDEKARLKEILTTADLVKFARLNADEETALLNLQMAIKFVHNTQKLIENSSDEGETEK